MRLYNFLLLLFAPVALYGQSIKEYVLHFNQNDFSYLEKECGYQIVSIGKDVFVRGDTLDPALPCVGVNILIAPNERYDGVDIGYNEVMVLSDAIIAPNPAQEPTNSPQSISGRSPVTYKKAKYPHTNIEYTGTHLMDGYKYLSFVICPFNYDAKMKQLFLMQDIKIRLRLCHQTDSVKQNSSDSYKIVGKNMHDMLIRNIINGKEIDSMYPKSSFKGREGTTSTPYDYIIVTNDSLRPVFENLAHWKTIKGVKSKVITVDECCDEYPNYTPPLAIKTVLSNYYTNGMTYTLLGGDTDVVPAQICFTPQVKTVTFDTPADLYYACLDSCFSWDGNGNQVYGEFYDHIDLDPEFIITRVPVSNRAEAEIFVNRIIEYECSPKTNGWTNKMLSCGNIISRYETKNGKQISDAQYQGEYVYENSIQDNWNGTLFKLFDTYTDHVDSVNYEANDIHFQLELEKGYTFVDEYSHGWTNRWGYLENNTIYKADKASSLVNNGYSIITTIACYTNAFDKKSTDFGFESDYYTTCLSESFIRNPHSGVLAFLGSSREGWYNCSYCFNEKFYESLFTGNDKQFGRAAMFAKIANHGRSSTEYFDNFRKIIMSLNPIGDPEMPVYTDLPQSFNNVTVSFLNGTLIVTTGVSDCKICVSSVADYGNSYYELSDSTNAATFSGINTDCYLCITKTGYITYVARIGSSVFLQNETINRDLPIISSVTFAGNDVTTSKPQGPVSIENGKVTINSQGTVTFKNNFEVKIGAELEVLKP